MDLLLRSSGVVMRGDVRFHGIRGLLADLEQATAYPRIPDLGRELRRGLIEADHLDRKAAHSGSPSATVLPKLKSVAGLVVTISGSASLARMRSSRSAILPPTVRPRSLQTARSSSRLISSSAVAGTTISGAATSAMTGSPPSATNNPELTAVSMTLDSAMRRLFAIHAISAASRSREG